MWVCVCIILRKFIKIKYIHWHEGIVKNNIKPKTADNKKIIKMEIHNVETNNTAKNK